MSASFQVDDTNVMLKVAVTDSDGAAVDLTDLETCTFILLSPGEEPTRTEHTGEVQSPATAGIVTYHTEAEDLFVAGTWKLQVRLQFEDGTDKRTAVTKFKVLGNI